MIVWSALQIHKIARLIPGLVLLLSFSVEAAYPIDSELDGPKSQYSQLLVQLLKQWPPKGVESVDRLQQPIQLKCLETAGNAQAIGLEQVMRIHAPLARVVEVLDDFSNYSQLFSGFDEIRIVSRDGNRILTFWEQHIPLFFVPNAKYEMTYLVDKGNPHRTIYRYQLRSGKALKYSDGIIVVEAESPEYTRFTEYDFFDADWGLLGVVSPSRIWRESVEGLFLSDVAIKLKAEHATTGYGEIRKQAKDALEKYPISEVLKKREPFSLSLKAGKP